MKKKKSLGTRITIAIMAVLAYGILSAGITGMVCLVEQSQRDMSSSMAERVASASNLVSSTLQHYNSLIASLDGTQEQADAVKANDPCILEVNTSSGGTAGVSTNSDGNIVITGTYSKGTASVTTDISWLGTVIGTMNMSDSTEFYLLDGSGAVIASMNGTLSADQISGYLGGVQTVNLNGKQRTVCSEQLKGTDWQAFVSCDASEWGGNSTLALIVMIITTAISFVVGVIIIRRFVKKIIVPLQSINSKIMDMSEGKLSTGNVEVHTGDELQTLAEAVNSMAENTEDIIMDIQSVAAKIAAEDLTAEPAANYVGDYLPIRESLEGIIGSTSGVIRQIESSSKLVSDGSGKMSDNSTTLSQAAAEQAATVEELNASIVEISSKISANAESAAQAKDLADDCRTIVDEGNVKMTDMLRAMEEINEASGQIANIIKTIQDISFQTNILSLNASIEAARAGEAGKGFAVVAGEVGQLAGKTAEAAKNTTSLIKTALAAVENGTVIANETAQMLGKIVEETDDTAKVIEKIAAASQEQADSVKQILGGMDQISSSVQMTSGSSAECAASAEELSEQAKVLLELVQRFQLAEPGKKPATVQKPKPEEKPVNAESPVPDVPEKKPEKKAVKAEKAAKPDKQDKPAKAEKTKKSEKQEKAPEIKSDPKPAPEKPKAKKPESRKPEPKKQEAPAPKPASKPAEKVPAPVPAAEKPASKSPKRTIILDDDKY